MSQGDKLLIVGGYGHVGRVISTVLGERFPGRVIAAGRNYREAASFSEETEGKVFPLQIDVRDSQASAKLPEDVKLVVMCVEQPDARFIANCLQQGIHYVDVSASYKWLSRVEEMQDDARRGNSTAVLSVGLAPGLTSLMAAYHKETFDEVNQLDIFIMLGLGEVHGEEAVRWTIGNANRTFYVHEGEKVRHVRSFGESKTTIFPEEIGSRRAYRFDFSDQHVLPKTLDIPSASTWLCFDSRLATWGFALAQKTGLLQLLRLKAGRELLVRALRTVHFGSEQFSIRVNAQGLMNGQPADRASAVSGYREGYMTGKVAAEVAERLYTSSHPAGIFHIEQLFAPAEFLASLEPSGLKFIPSLV